VKYAYYFSHDSNSRHDHNILHLRSKYGWEGYGLFWAVVEILRDIDGYKYPKRKMSLLAFELQYPAAEQFINDCIHEFELFVEDEDSFWSESLLRRMERCEEICQKRRNAGKRGGDSKSQAIAKQLPSKLVALKERKGKENKVNTSAFESWYAEYPRKIAKAAALKAWKARMNEGISADELTRARDGYKAQADLSNPKYILHPSTFLGLDRRWVDYLPKPPPEAPPRKPCPRCTEPLVGNSCPACGWSIDDGA